VVSREVEIEPFVVAIDDAVLADLRERLIRTRWPDELSGAGWDYGTDLAYLKDLVATWVGEFDWRLHERALNRLHHFRADIDGLAVHFIHERGTGPAPMPLVLTHGWPSSFVEYLDLIPLLIDPASHGGDAADAFDVVVPSLPGFGFSGHPSMPGLLSADIADLWSRLMTDGLGYTRFGAHGSDIGAGVSVRLAQRHPGGVAGIHLSAWGSPEPPQPWSAAERDYLEANQQWDRSEGAYSEIQATKPQTVGYGLNDSPAGLAAWIVEKFRAWSDSGGDVESRITRERLLTNLTIYWATATITSSMRPYYEHRHHGTPLAADDPIHVPTGFAVFANEFTPIGRLPRELAERYFAVTRWRELPTGGHFPALEEPQLLAEEIRATFRPLRAS
jgi:pimeloyl-ACP methyl ester carboxylesterase